MEFENTDVSADSSSATSTTDGGAAPTSQATEQPAGAQPKGFHEHPDWQRMVTSRREDRAVIQRLQGEIQRLSAATQRASSGEQPLTQEEQAALSVLERLAARSPKLAAAMRLAEQAPNITKGMEGFQQSEARAARAQTMAARGSIKDMATEYGLPTDDASLKHIVRLVAGAAMEMPEGNERYAGGDLDILREAFEQVKPWLTAMRKPAEQAAAQTKTKTKGLPPRPGAGAAPGPAAPMVRKQGEDDRAYETRMHATARDRLNALLNG